MLDTTPLQNLIKPYFEKITELKNQAQQLRKEGFDFYSQASEKEKIVNKKIFKKKSELEEIKSLTAKGDALHNQASELDNERYELENVYYPVMDLVNTTIFKIRFINDEKNEEELLQTLGNSYFESGSMPAAESLYRKCYETYQKAPFIEVKAILDEVEGIFMTRFPQKWQKVNDEFAQERIKNMPKPKTEDYSLNPNLFIETPPVNTYMTDIRTGESIYYQDGNYIDKNGNPVSLTYAD